MMRPIFAIAKMRRALSLVRERASWLEVDGEMRGDLALDGRPRSQSMPRSTLAANANLRVLPNLDAANIAHNLLKAAAGATSRWAKRQRDGAVGRGLQWARPAEPR